MIQHDIILCDRCFAPVVGTVYGVLCEDCWVNGQAGCNRTAPGYHGSRRDKASGMRRMDRKAGKMNNYNEE